MLCPVVHMHMDLSSFHFFKHLFLLVCEHCVTVFLFFFSFLAECFNCRGKLGVSSVILYLEKVT